MPITATVTLECEGCDEEVVVDLDPNKTPEDALDSEGWFLDGAINVRVICGKCYEKVNQ